MRRAFNNKVEEFFSLINKKNEIKIKQGLRELCQKVAFFSMGHRVSNTNNR